MSLVETVLGPVYTDDLGITLTHEHLVSDMRFFVSRPRAGDSNAARLMRLSVGLPLLDEIRRAPFYSPDNWVLDDYSLIRRELSLYKKAGGSSLVEMTLPGEAQDPLELRRIAKATGINVIASCGYYIQVSHPKHVASSSIDQLQLEFVKSTQQGIGHSNVKAGIIKAAVSPMKMTPQEEKVLRAAARAHVETKVPIVTHSWMNSPGERQRILDILEEENVDLRHVLMHGMDNMDSVATPDRDWRFVDAIAERGAYVGFDTFGMEFPMYFNSDFVEGIQIHDPTDYERAVRIKELIANGFLHHIMLSQDVCMKIQLKAFGGYGYAHLLTNCKRIMKYAGVTEKEQDTMLVQNPRSFFKK